MKMRTKRVWAIMAAAMLVGAGLTPAAAATGSWDTTRGTTTPVGTGSGATSTASTTSTGAASGTTSEATPPTLSAGQVLVAGKTAAPFAVMAGSQENAVALATALRTGTTANLTFTSTSATGESIQTTAELAIPTKPMGWGNVSHALALAQTALRQAGIENPTAADLQAALTGGTVTTSDGKTIALAGVLQQRADGMGWGQIAKSYGTTMGAVNRGLKAPAVSIASEPASAIKTSSTSTRPAAVSGAATGRGGSGVTTASGAPGNSSAAGNGSKGLVTAAGALSNNGANSHGAKGVTTASGTTAGGPSGVVSAAGNGQGNALGRGVVTAAGGGASSAAVGARGGMSGVLTGSGAGSSGVTTADSAGGRGNANGHGKGKDGS